jgi:molybdate transport system ATP-binding protein
MTRRLIVDGSIRRSAFTLQVRLDVDLDQPMGLQGVTGAGKTTLLRIIAGLEPDFIGHVQWDARVWSDTTKGINVPTYQRRLGVVFQDARLLPGLTVLENLRFALKRSPSKMTAPQLEAMADDFYIGDLMRRPIDALSGGERQRVSLVQALLRRPQLLLLDEPLSANDHDHRRKVALRLSEWLQKERVPLIFVSHSLHELNLLTQTILQMDAGRIVAQGPAENMLKPETVHTHFPALVLEVNETLGHVTIQCAPGSSDSGIPALKPGDQIEVSRQTAQTSDIGAPLKPQSEQDEE